MKYAPIIIPTLNRIEHLKRCITSLQKNPWAKYTLLVISVDYPPEDKYVSGYKQVCSYLREGVNGFANVEIIYQSQNLGAYENAEYLKNYVRKKSDRYIFSEDDNEFSPNFIEYVDKGLAEFEQDENIIAICSSGADSNDTREYNVALSQYFAAYGYGTWIIKMEQYSQQINRECLENIVGDIGLMFKLAYPHPGYIFALQSALFRKDKLYELSNGDIPIIDQTITIYMFTNEKYVVVPCVNKTRNWGYDGSGVNCGSDTGYDVTKTVIDKRDHFDFHYSYPLKKVRLHGQYSIEIICRIIVAFVKLETWKLYIKLKNHKIEMKRISK